LPTGITAQLCARVLEVQGRSGTGVKIRLRTAAGQGTIKGSDLLAAVGRTPNTSRIGLDVAGVGLDERGYVAVNDRLETSVADIWAVGECAGSSQFTDVSFDDFRIIRDRLRVQRQWLWSYFTGQRSSRLILEPATGKAG
jgi:pyruvate/2-oxoglutarate dehydrogenase complex dihydrolipoamide dehydrogenase (E3) component